MPAPDPRTTVVMITHNRREQVLESLAAFRRLPERPPIIVVDNGSCDGSAAAVTAEFPEVRLCCLKDNAGPSARNLGVELATTPYIAFADDDTCWAPGSIAQAADLLDRHPRLGLAVARVLIGRENRDDPINAVLERSPLPRLPEMPGPPLVGFLAGASAVRRDAFLAAGGYQSWMFLGGEEQLLALDLTLRGWWLCYVRELVVHHYPSPLRDATLREVCRLRNSLWFAWLRRPLPIAMRSTTRLAWSSLRDRIARRALRQALAGLPRLLRQRRCVPAEIERQLALLDLPLLPSRPRLCCPAT